MKYIIQRFLILAAAMVTSSLLVIGVAYAAGETLNRSAINNGGGTVTNGQITVRSTVGQPVAGAVSSGRQTLCSGLVCGAAKSDEGTITGLTASNDGPTLFSNHTSFSALATGGSGVTFSWDFGDGTGSIGPNPTHTYAAVGSYTATVSASDGGAPVTAQTTVEVSHAIVEVSNFAFSPSPVTIEPGQRVTWLRIEGTHNIKADDGSFTSGPPTSTWTSYSRTFDTAGDFPYYCELHGGMGGNGMAGVIKVEKVDNGADDFATYLPLISTSQ